MLAKQVVVPELDDLFGPEGQSPAYRRITERRGRKVARVAAARKLLTLVYYGMRDGRIGCLAEAG